MRSKFDMQLANLNKELIEMNQTQIQENDAAAQIQEVNYEFLRKITADTW